MSHHACRYGRPDGIVLAHFFFFFNDTATTEIYTLSLHDALPILVHPEVVADPAHDDGPRVDADPHLQTEAALGLELLRSEEHTSELQSRLHLVCRLLLEKKKTTSSVQPFRTFNAHPTTSWPPSPH